MALRSREDVLAEIERNRRRRAEQQAFAPPQALDPSTSSEEVAEEGSAFGFVPGPIRSGFGFVGDVFGAIDKPISERIGFRFGDAPGPLDEIANFAVEELTRPTNLLFAIPAAGASMRLARSSNRAARALGALIEPTTGARSGLGARVAGEVAVSVGARGGSELAAETLPEDAGLLASVATPLAGGLAGGAAAVTLARHALRPFITDPVIRPATLDDGEAILPHPKAAELYGHTEIRAGLTPGAELRNAIRSSVPFKKFVLEDAVATPAELARRSMYHNADSVANAVEHQVHTILHSAFDIDPETSLVKGLVSERFPGGMTIPDIYARQPEIEHLLTNDQRAALDQAYEIVRPYIEFAPEVFKDLGTRPDVMDGGRYWTRGTGLDEDYEAPSYVAKGFKGKPNFAHAAKYDSAAQAIAEGYRYDDPAFAIGGMVRRIGREAADHHVRNYLLNVRDPLTGQKVAETWRDRLTEDEANIEKLLKQTRARSNAYRDALLRTEGAAGEAARFAGKTDKELDAAATRMAKAIEKMDAAQFDPGDVRAALDDMRDVAVEGRALAQRVAHNELLLQRARQDMRPYQKLLDKSARLQKALDEMANIEMQMEVDANPESLKQAYLNARRRAARIQRELDDIDLDDTARTLQQMEDRINNLIEEGAIYRDRSKELRSAEVQARRQALHELKLERSVAAAERGVSVMQREHDRLLRFAVSTSDRAAKLEAERAARSIKVEGQREKVRELQRKWADIKATAMQTPKGQSRIYRYNLDDYTFADETASIINRMLEQEGRPTGRGSEALQFVHALNNLYRGLKATADMSYLGIQAILGGTAGKAGAEGYWNAYKMTMRAMFGSGENSERALGMMLRDMDKRSLASGLIDTQTWTANNLRIGGTATEFELKAGFQKAGLDPRHRPAYRRADRAFGFAGDAQRRVWAENILKSELAKGKTLQQMLESGEVRQIAEAVNRMTGWTGNRFAGSLGDLLLFAPRFLQSRLETIASAYRGLSPNAALDDRLARDAMMRFIAMGTTLTLTLNWALEEAGVTQSPGGREGFLGATDIRPIVDGRFNPNFMRIRAFDQDWSVFGTWDSLLRMMVLTAQGDAPGAVRGLTSGTVSAGWDLLSGKNFSGDPTRDSPEDLGRWLFGSVLPFAASDMGGRVSELRKGDFTALAGAVGDVFGVKSAAMTPSEHRDAAARDMFGVDWSKLSGEQRTKLEEERPEVISRAEEHLKQRAERGEEWAQLQLRREEIDRNRGQLEMEALFSYMSGEITLSDFAESLDGIQRDAATRKQELDVVFKADRNRENEPQWQALEAYYDTYDLAEVAPGVIDWEKRELLEQELLQRISRGEFGDPQLARKFIDERRVAEHAPEVQWYFDAKKYITESGYYATKDAAYEKLRKLAENIAGEPLPTYGAFVRVMNRARISGDQRVLRGLEILDLRAERIASAQKERMRRSDPELDAALLNTGRVSTPINQRRRR